MSDELFNLKNVSYGDWVSFDDIIIKRGYPTFIMGDSGCGKTTMLKFFNATLSPTTGDIYYSGKNLNEYDILKLRQEVSLVRQEPFLFDLSIKDNFREFYSYRKIGILSDDEMEYFLNLCNLKFPLDKNCKTMSGGERQRVFLAIFLSLKPKVLLLDEPTSALDEKTSNIVMNNIIEYCKSFQIEFIAISHDRKIVDKYSRQTIEFIKGEGNERSCKLKYN